MDLEPSKLICQICLTGRVCDYIPGNNGLAYFC